MPRKKEMQVGLGMAIRKTRTEAGLKQKELARRLEVDPSEISRLEKGTVNPSWGRVRRLAACLETPLVELVNLADELERRLGEAAT